jgi:hypothetical protein
VVHQEDVDRCGCCVVGWVYVDDLGINTGQIRRCMAWAYVKYAADKSLFWYDKES